MPSSATPVTVDAVVEDDVAVGVAADVSVLDTSEGRLSFILTGS